MYLFVCVCAYLCVCVRVCVANQGTDEDTSAEDTGSDSDREEFCKKRRNRGRRRCRPCRSQPGGCNRPNRPDRPDRPQEINENIPKGNISLNHPFLGQPLSN